jgi:hypothetical protein
MASAADAVTLAKASCKRSFYRKWGMSDEQKKITPKDSGLLLIQVNKAGNYYLKVVSSNSINLAKSAG